MVTGFRCCVNKHSVAVTYNGVTNSRGNLSPETGHGGRINRALVSRAGNHGFKPWSNQINDLLN